MKNIIVLFFALALAATTQAQSTYRTDVSIRSQYVNNNLPGARYFDPAAKTSQARETQQKGVGTQMKENAIPGVHYRTGNSGGGSAAAQEPSAAGVTSDKKPAKAEPIKVPEAPKNITQ